MMLLTMANEITSPSELIRVIARKNGISVGLLVGKNRKRGVVDIRASLVKTLRKDWHMSYAAIGRLLNRDHATAMLLYKRMPKKTVEYVVPKNPEAKVLTPV